MPQSAWTILDTGPASAQHNMELDAKLLEELDPTSSSPILHLYDWILPSATYGHFIDPSRYFLENPLLDVAKRPTGGGIIFHTSDWAFSALVPAAHPAYSLNIMENYAFINHLVIDLITQFMGNSLVFQLSLLPQEPPACNKEASCFCMAKPTRYDVMINGKKVGGGAQRRTKAGFLHQGSLSLTPPDKNWLESVLLPDISVRQDMENNTFALLGSAPLPAELQEARRALASLFKSQLKRKQGNEFYITG